jgi:hypothetical protein
LCTVFGFSKPHGATNIFTRASGEEYTDLFPGGFKETLETLEKAPCSVRKVVEHTASGFRGICENLKTFCTM